MKNLWLADNYINVFVECRHILYQPANAHIIPFIVFTYLRVISDHSAQSLQQLRQKEVTFCAPLLRERFEDCMAIGRDLIRLLIEVARIPEFEAIWNDLLNAPSKLTHKLQSNIIYCALFGP